MGILKRKTVIAFAVVLVLLFSGSMTPTLADSDPLPSWNVGAHKQAILDFVHDTTTEGTANFVPTAERIATFDQDGTLWVEQPIYAQLMFDLVRINELAPQHPEWKTKQPFATVLSGDHAAMAKFSLEDIEKIVGVTQSGMTVEQYPAIVKQWLAAAKHPRFKKPCTQLIYQPMLEVIRYLQNSGFKTYIVTGGGQEFVRVFADQVYGIPPQQVIGTAGQTKYGYAADGKPELMKLPKMLFLDDQGGKPQSINLIIGRRPYAAFGNSTGDQEMLEWTGAGGGKRLMMLVHHDDAVREYAYGADSDIGTFSDALANEAKQRGWNVISMKDDWKKIFP
jgi:phosphoglycolate phosphatase-like HAD superfamily hydrolase